MKKLFAMVLALCMVLSIVACGDDTTKTTASAGETETTAADSTTKAASDDDSNWLTVISKKDNGSLYMYISAINRWGKAEVGPFCQTLWQYDSDLNLQNVLATGLTYDDDYMGVTITLRDDVVWHNGDPFTADDVVYTFTKCLAESPAANNYNYIDYNDVTAVDAHTVHVGLTREMAVFDHRSSDLFIYSKTFKEGTNTKDTEGNELIECGTGAFIVTEYVKDDHVSFRKNDNYWGTAAKLDGITIRFVSEASTAFLEVQSGGAQISNNTSQADLSDVQAGNYADITASDDAKMQHNFVAMNEYDDHFTTATVRKAINYAVNRQEIFEVAFEGVGSMAWSCLSVDVPGYDTSMTDNYPYEYDPDEAKKLLAEAGYADGFSTTFAIENNTLQKTIAEMFKEYLAAVGIDVEIKMYESAALTALIPTADWGLSFNTYNQNGDPSSALTFGTSIRNVGGSNKFNNDKDPVAIEYTELLESSESIRTAEERNEVFKEMQQLYLDTIWEVPLADLSVYVVQSTSVGGYWGAGVQPHFEECYFID